ncbi:MAG: hypothetical protein QOG43_962 [Actinomycetota bacterium]|nr:hypothetical protein [Actinomycetota bacterium]
MSEDQGRRSTDREGVSQPAGRDGSDATRGSRRPPMSAAARERLERTIALRIQDPEFHRKVEAVRRGLAGETASSQ